MIEPYHTSTIPAKGGWVTASRGLASETEEELRWGGDVRIANKSHQLPKEPRRDLTLSVLRPSFSYRQIFQSFWTNASHYSSSPEGVETVLPHFLARFDRSFSTDSTAIVQRGR